MHINSKLLVAAFLCLLIFSNPLYAAELKWKDIKGLEKSLLIDHKNEWNSYGKSKKKVLYSSAKKKAKKLRKYKKWIKNNLTPKEKKQLKENFRKMKDKQLKKYMKTLFKKYGKPV